MRISDWSSDVCSSDLRIAGLFQSRPPFGSGERILQHHRVLAVRAGADDGDRASGPFLQRAQVGAGGGREVVLPGDAVGVFAPAGELQVHRIALVPAMGVAGGLFGVLYPVPDGVAHLQLVIALATLALAYSP